MGQALYRKYRPKSLADVVGQDPIIKTLKNALKTGALSHAYLFTGPRGVGKTSIARILAHEINGLAYTDDETHLDIIEIDAASNRRIDEIRELRDKIHIAPTSAKYKVYIIDEVHMLTREAFNALLKTLEEPPAHAIFILATTEAHKVPETITSRAQRFSFRPIQADDVVSHLQSIAKKEAITVEKEALLLLAEHAKGSFRDSINLLDQLAAASKTITTAHVLDALGTASDTQVSALLHAIDAQNPKDIMQLLQDARIEGVHAGEIATKLMHAYRERMQHNAETLYTETLQLLHELLLVQTQAEPYLALELAILKSLSVPATLAPVHVATDPLAKKEALNSITAAAQQPTVTQLQQTPVSVPVPKAQLTEQPEKTAKKTTTTSKSTPVIHPTVNSAIDQDFWKGLLASMKGQHNTLYGTLRMAEPRIENDVLTLAFRFAFHQKQISQAHNIEKIAAAVQTLTGTPMQIVCVVLAAQPENDVEATNQPSDLAETTPHPATPAPRSQVLSDVSNIFDGAELLE